MAEFQPPGGLRDKIAEKILADWWPAGDYEAVDREQVRTTVADVLAALFEACEVREERRIVIDDERCAGLPINGLWVVPPAMADTHKSLLGRYSSARMERRFVIETPPEPPSTGEEKTDRG